MLPNNYGVIIRTAAMGQQDEEIKHDILSLIERWKKVISGVRNSTAPALILNEENRTTTIIRDLLNGSFSSICIDDQTVYEEVREYIRTIAPEKEKNRQGSIKATFPFSTISTYRNRSCRFSANTSR